MKSSYITSAQKAEQLPDFPHQEVAFIGRSNVGKSSLLNAVLDRSGLARESKTPGRTQMVNFFSVEKGEKQVILADLPGYGYSAIGKGSRKDWAALVDGYLQRDGIRLFLFLLDCRRAQPLNSEDKDLLRSLTRCNVPEGVIIVLTKSDKIGSNELSKTMRGLKDDLAKEGITPAQVIAVSTLKKTGLVDLKRAVLSPLDVE